MISSSELAATRQLPGFPTQPTRRTDIGGMCWILTTVVFFAGQIVAQAAWIGTPYSLVHNPISDLGTTVCETVNRGTTVLYVCSPLHTVMNISFAVTGVLILLGLVLTRNVWPRRRLTTWGLSCLALAGLGKVVVGFVPWNVDPTIHTLGGLGFIIADVGLILLGLAIGRELRWLASLPLLLGVVGLIGLMGWRSGVIVVGVGERLADYPMFVWFVVLGTSLIAWSRSRPA
jgi:hypothetical membrane protein